jgi:hypothetical protein
MFLITWLAKLIYGEEAYERATKRKVKPKRRR